MRQSELLSSIRGSWLTKVPLRLAKGEVLRENITDLLNRFFDLLLQAVETGDPSWLIPVLDEMLETRTQSDLENVEGSFTQMFNQIILGTFEVINARLNAQNAILLIDAVLPNFLESLDYAARKETILQVKHISRELEKANATLERLEKSKSDFIAVAAHELKTPLTLIEGYSGMLYDLVPKDDYSQAIILLKGMDNGIGRLREIVDDMIDISLIDNNLLKLQYQPVWVGRLLSGLEKEIKPILKERSQLLKIRKFQGSDEMTFADAERLFQAYRNIMLNAIKYTPDGGTILINGRLLPGFIETTIADSGIGIDPGNHSRIFEKFGRIGEVSLHSSGKTKYKGGGPGLGLSITKGIIEAHGGAVWVESPGFDEVNCPGSTFHLLLPVRKTAPDERTARLFSPFSEP